ncbi:MAG: UDP-N-acetylmuramoyl-L-alanine--D-glutamate ligase [Bacteroidales bacterium]|nr:UDP-N-acetylmuramoyl-L-alanine--D-glutamate ligase [Bacteroidales bacterium]
MYREQQLKALLEGRRILIAGYGREGRSAERLIQHLVPEAQYTIATQVENGKWKTESGEWRTEWPFDMVIKSPGIPNFQFSILNYQLTSLTDLFLQVYGDMTIGVTGTKGKSTTASLIHHLLPGSILAGNIGIPLFDILDELREDSTVVAELSCHQLENIHRSPHIAVLLNLFQEHLDHYENYMGYKMAKMQIALKQQSGDHFFYCTDNEELRSLVESGELSFESELHPYSINDITVEERSLLESCPLEGEHNRSNALVACRVAQLMMRQPLTTLRSPLSTFHGLHHRLEKVGVYAGITWYDDSISTIPAAAIAAVRSLGRVDTLILGGFDRGIDYSPLVDFLTQAIRQSNTQAIKNLVFVGAAGRRIHKEFSIHNSQFSILIEDDYTKIVPWCAEHTPQGGVVLLSPAAASYDAFKNFEHRGDFFREQILKLDQN